MTSTKMGCGAATLVLILGGLVTQIMAEEPPAVPWNKCCAVRPWATGRAVMKLGYMVGTPRLHLAMGSGVPEPYREMRNPLPRTLSTVERGAVVYKENCISCHDMDGLGQGPAGHNLSPPPGNLAWLAAMPAAQLDSFLYWTVAEGGVPFGSSMPAFRTTLSERDTWAVVAYMQARLPPKTIH